ncbi:hypothetical protein DFQ08_101829 [Winogradskyella arenosi]|uniref:Uncharacterized protein n=1 Tax=Winogradskyella arenosi TaxID=533325 RepID=A0A368ZN96_9FLAO|nr:hypothetical protein DFQ08_101829 [Winogradskyella arenosi]
MENSIKFLMYFAYGFDIYVSAIAFGSLQVQFFTVNYRSL